MSFLDKYIEANFNNGSGKNLEFGKHSVIYTDDFIADIFNNVIEVRFIVTIDDKMEFSDPIKMYNHKMPSDEELRRVSYKFGVTTFTTRLILERILEIC